MVLNMSLFRKIVALFSAIFWVILVISLIAKTIGYDILLSDRSMPLLMVAFFHFTITFAGAVSESKTIHIRPPKGDNY